MLPTDTTPRPLHIVVGHDLSPQAELALRQALLEARPRSPAFVHVVGVVNPSYGGYTPLGVPWQLESDTLASMQEQLKRSVERTLDEDHDTAAIPLVVHARHGRPADEILELADELSASLVVVGTHGRRGVSRMMLGSVAEEVVRRANCPVLVARRPDYREVEPEPPCPRCVEARRESDGEVRWCEAHSRPWVKPHRYSYHSSIAPTRPDAWALW